MLCPVSNHIRTNTHTRLDELFQESNNNYNNNNNCNSNNNNGTEEAQLLTGQGILSVPGIAGYEWVPARIGRFDKYNFFS